MPADGGDDASDSGGTGGRSGTGGRGGSGGAGASGMGGTSGASGSGGESGASGASGGQAGDSGSTGAGGAAGDEPTLDAAIYDAEIEDAAMPEPGCGDGVLDDGEVCDDGNRYDDDFCSSNCDDFDVACTTDHLDSWGIGDAWGQTLIGDSKDFVPLCGGHVIAASEDLLGVSIYDVVHNHVVWSLDLNAAPSALEIDRGRGLLYVALDTGRIMRIDLATEEIVAITAGSPTTYANQTTHDLELGELGIVFASGTWGYVIDGPDGAAVNTDPIAYLRGSLAYDREYNKLYALPPASFSSSETAYLHEFQFDEDENELSHFLQVRDVGHYPYDIAVSPDSASLAIVAGGGNDPERWDNSVFHWPSHSQHFSYVHGDWARPDWVPVSADFSVDSRFIALSGYGEINVFSTTHHGLISSLRGEGCYGDHEIAWSPGGKLIYQMSLCEGGDIQNVLWRSFTAPVPEPLPSNRVCGNGVLEQGEMCDDGNRIDSDLCSANCLHINPLCTSDRNVASIPLSGSDNLGAISRIVPLCDGWVLVASAEDSTITLRNVVRGQTMRTYRLPNRASDLALDATTGRVWAALGPSPSLAELDLDSGVVRELELAGGPAYLVRPVDAFGVIAVQYDELLADHSLTTSDRSVQLISSETGQLRGWVPNDVTAMEVAPTSRKLFTISTGVGLERYQYDSQSMGIVLEQTNSAQRLVISQDETKMILGCTYSGGTYGMSEHSTSSFARLGRYGSACSLAEAYSHDNTRFFTLGASGLRMFETASRAGLSTFFFPQSACYSNSSPTQLAVSRGGLFAYLTRHCGSGPLEGEPLVWVKIP